MSLPFKSAAESHVKWDQGPEAIKAGLVKMFSDFLTGAKATMERDPSFTFDDSVHAAAAYTSHTYHDLKDLAVSLLASAAGAIGATPENIRVDVTDPTVDGISITLFVRRDADLADASNDVEVGTVRLSYTPEATVEKGYFYGVNLSLTPAGSQNLWKQGGVINVNGGN